MDFIVKLPPSAWRNQVFDSILVVVDRYTKMARYILCTKRITTDELADLLACEVFNKYSVPLGMVSNCRAIFTSDF